MMEELRINVAVKMIQDSKQQLSDLRSSASPVTSELLDKVQSFLTALEKEIATALPKESRNKENRFTKALVMLLALDRLLQELVPGAFKVIEQLLSK